MDDSIYWPAFHQKRLQKIAYTILATASIEAYRAIKGCDPANVCDIGCSSGILLYRLKEQMPALVTDGCDYSVHPDDVLFEGKYTEQDLNAYAGGAVPSYDMLISQEVLEHIEPENTAKALQFITDLARPGALLIFGAARPGQKGTHHVNCKRKKEWIGLLQAIGWTYSLPAHLAYNAIIDRDDTVRKKCFYYKRNTVCLTRN